MMSRIAALAVVLAGAATGRAADGPPAEAKHVAPGFCAAVVIDPARLDKSATAAGLTVGDLWKLVEQFTGADAKSFERVTVLIEPFPGGNVAFFPAFVLRYPAGTDARKQLPKVLGEVKESTANGVTYHRSTKYQMAKTEMAGYAIDERTLLVAPWPTLEPMLKPVGGAKDRPLGAELAKPALTGDVVLIVTPAPFLAKVAEIEKKSGQPTDDPTWTAVRPVLEKTTAITVALDFGTDQLIRAEFRCTDDAAAGAVHAALKQQLAKAKEAYPDARKGLEQQIPPAAKPLLAALDELVNDHKLTRDGSTVVLTAARPKELTPKK
jgi:hypothetical protein